MSGKKDFERIVIVGMSSIIGLLINGLITQNVKQQMI